MKAVLQLFFILFYTTSAYAATEIRTVDVIKNVRYANSRSNDSTIERAGSKMYDSLPRYREALKATDDFQCRPVWTIDVVEMPGEILQADSSSHRLHFRLPPAHSRAPPAIT